MAHCRAAAAGAVAQRQRSRTRTPTAEVRAADAASRRRELVCITRYFKYPVPMFNKYGDYAPHRSTLALVAFAIAVVAFAAFALTLPVPVGYSDSASADPVGVPFAFVSPRLVSPAPHAANAAHVTQITPSAKPVEIHSTSHLTVTIRATPPKSTPTPKPKTVSTKTSPKPKPTPTPATPKVAHVAKPKKTPPAPVATITPKPSPPMPSAVPIPVLPSKPPVAGAGDGNTRPVFPCVPTRPDPGFHPRHCVRDPGPCACRGPGPAHSFDGLPERKSRRGELNP